MNAGEGEEAKDNKEQIEPNETLYINNLNDKIKIEELKQALLAVFSQFGEIISIRARSSIKLKGQAFITFSTIDEATNAKNQLNNSIFLDKKLQIEFAKTKCDIALVKVGKMNQEEKKQNDLLRKRKRDDFYKSFLEKNKKNEEDVKDIVSDNNQTITKKIVLDEKSHNTLFVEGIQKDISEKDLENIFKQEKGFKNIHIFTTRGICFLTFDNVIDAATVKEKYDQKTIGANSKLSITYAKK